MTLKKKDTATQLMIVGNLPTKKNAAGTERVGREVNGEVEVLLGQPVIESR